MGKINDLTGNVYGVITVLNFSHRDKKSNQYWVCQCVCSKKITLRIDRFVSRCIKECVCSTTTHGRYKTPTPNRTTDTGTVSPEYNCWAHMKKRCLNPRHQNYSDYGGRGITVCERWLSSFENFYKDMGKRPSDKHSLDRIDFNGNYEPFNCRWATKIEQVNNTRSNVWLEINNEKRTRTEWSKILGVSNWVIGSQLKKGITFTDIYNKYINNDNISRDK